MGGKLSIIVHLMNPIRRILKAIYLLGFVVVMQLAFAIGASASNPMSDLNDMSLDGDYGSSSGSSGGFWTTVALMAIGFFVINWMMGDGKSKG